jgi:ankyrin repeat protein
VFLQVEALWDDCRTDADIRAALANLPKDLRETYRRCLGRIDLQDRYALKVLKWVSYATRPLRIDELREAVAFNLSDRSWTSDNIPHPSSLLSCCANLVVLDAIDNCVRLAHPSVRQYLEENCGDDALAFPNSTQGELDCGEFCVTYLSFSNFSLQIETNSDVRLPVKPDLLATLAQGSLGAIASTLGRLASPKQPQQRKPIHMRLPRKLAAVPCPRQYRFLAYAVENWAVQTKTITSRSVVWVKFQELAINPNKSWNFHPWICGGQSQNSHLHGLFGWAVKERHIPLLKIVLSVNTGRGPGDFYDLPLVGGSLPALHTASRLGYEDVVKLLLKVCAVGKQDDQKYTPLHHAAENGHYEVVKLLSSAKGVRIDTMSAEHLTPLLLAIINGHTQIASMLMEKGARHELKDNKGLTPLSHAARRCHNAIIELLIEKGAKIESKDNTSRTPLSWAASNGDEAAVKLLVWKGANLESKDNSGQTPLSWAARYGEEAVVKLLIEGGTDLESKDILGQTPLSWAAWYGRGAVVKLLIERGADLESKDDLGQTPLSWAARYGEEAVVKLLIERGADLESKDISGQTPLSWAA